MRFSASRVWLVADLQDLVCGSAGAHILHSDPHPSTINASKTGIWIDLEIRESEARCIILRTHTVSSLRTECGRSAEAKHAIRYSETENSTTGNADHHDPDDKKGTASHSSSTSVATNGSHPDIET